MTDERIGKIRIGAVATVLLVAVIIYLLLPVVALRWARLPFPGFLMDPHLVSSAIGESDWPAKQLAPPVTYPERLVAVDGRSVTDKATYEAEMAARSVGETADFTLLQPQDSIIPPTNPAQPERTITLPLIKLDSQDLWNQFWLFYLTGVFILVIGIWTFWVRPDAEAAQIFALLAAAGALAVGGLFDLVSTKIFVRIWILALSLFGSCNVLLVAVFPHEIRLVNKYPRSKWLVLLPGTAIAVWGQIWLHGTQDVWAYAIPWRAAYFLNGLALLASLGIMVYRGFWSPSPLVRQQSRLILVGAVLAFTPLVVFFLLAPTSIDVPWLTETVYVPPVVIYPLAIGYAVIRFRLLRMNIKLRRRLVFALLTGLLVVVLTLVVTGITAAFTPGVALDNPLWLAMLIVIVALVFDPVRSRLQRGLEQALFRQPVALDELLRAYNRELTTAVDADEVAQKLLHYAEKGVLYATPCLYLPDNKMNCYSAYNDDNGVMVDMASPIVSFMQRHTGAIDLVEERAWPDTFRENRETIAALKAAALVPLNNGRELLGWLTLSPKENRQHLTQAELGYLDALADQSLIGLERANVIRRLERRVAELDLLSQYSQYLNFTIKMDDLMELAYTHYNRLLGIDEFFISWRNPDTDRIFRIFHVEQDERLQEREGPAQTVTDPRVLEVVQTGQQKVVEDEDGRFWIIAPLNAGADTLGAIHTFYREPGLTLLQREQQLFGVFADRTATAMDRLQTREQLEERAQQLEIINEMTVSLAATLELEPLLNLILDKAIELLDTEAGTFMLMIEDTGELEFRVVRGPASKDLIGKRLTIGTGLAGTAAQTGRPVLVNRVQEDKRWFNQVDATTDFESQSILTVPLLRQNAILGVVQVINKQNGAPFDEEDQTLLTAFAGQAVVALENARLWRQTDRELQERVNELFMLQQLDRDLNTTLDLDTVLNLTLDWILRICGGSAGAIVLSNGDGPVRVRTTRGYDDGFDAAPPNGEDLQEGLVGLVLRSGEPHVTGNVHEEAEYVDAAFATHSQMTIPVIHKQKLIGAIAIESDQMDAFDETALETAVRVTNHAAVAIANAILYEQVHEANQAKSEFVSVVSHELKTPMTSMRGYTDLMLSGMTGDLTDQQRNFLETIAVNIRRMSQQIQDLTDISRIETNHLHMEVGPIPFSNVVSETLEVVRGLCDDKDIEMHLDLPSDLPLVMGDRARLVQVLTNLLSNACKYSPPQTNVRVTLRPEAAPPQDGEEPIPMVLCAVRDEGYGISEEDQKQLFTKFFRADDPNIRQAKGTGLGLSITKGIVELHNGRIWVESAPGEGTTFYFTIPQAEQ